MLLCTTIWNITYRYDTGTSRHSMPITPAILCLSLGDQATHIPKRQGEHVADQHQKRQQNAGSRRNLLYPCLDALLRKVRERKHWFRPTRSLLVFWGVLAFGRTLTPPQPPRTVVFVYEESESPDTLFSVAYNTGSRSKSDIIPVLFLPYDI